MTPSTLSIPCALTYHQRPPEVPRLHLLGGSPQAPWSLPRGVRDGLGSAEAAGQTSGPPAHLDVHLGPLEEAQRGMAGTVGAQGHQLLELLQIEPEFGSSERGETEPSGRGDIALGTAAADRPERSGGMRGGQPDSCTDLLGVPLQDSPPSLAACFPRAARPLPSGFPDGAESLWLGRGEPASPARAAGHGLRALARAAVTALHGGSRRPGPCSGCSQRSRGPQARLAFHFAKFRVVSGHVTTEMQVYWAQGGPRSSPSHPEFDVPERPLHSRFYPCVRADKCRFSPNCPHKTQRHCSHEGFG